MQQNFLLDSLLAAEDGDTIQIPPEGTTESDLVEVRKKVRIVGSDRLYGYSPMPSVICPGIVNWAQQSEFQGFNVRPNNPPTEGDGVLVRSKMGIYNVYVYDFPGNGFSVNADVHRPGDYQNANYTTLWHCRARGNGKNGLFMDGGDVNVSNVTSFSAIDNGEWGIFDSGFLGSTYIACHTAANNGGYKTDNPSARHVFIGCYAEKDQIDSELSQHTLVLGGLFGGASGGQIVRDGKLSTFEMGLSGGESKFGGDAPFRVIMDGDHPRGWSALWPDDRTNTLQFRHADLDNRTPIRLTTDKTGASSQPLQMDGEPIPGGEVIINGFWVHNKRGKYVFISRHDLMKLKDL